MVKLTSYWWSSKLWFLGLVSSRLVFLKKFAWTTPDVSNPRFVPYVVKLRYVLMAYRDYLNVAFKFIEKNNNLKYFSFFSSKPARFFPTQPYCSVIIHVDLHLITILADNVKKTVKTTLFS